MAHSGGCMHPGINSVQSIMTLGCVSEAASPSCVAANAVFVVTYNVGQAVLFYKYQIYIGSDVVT